MQKDRFQARRAWLNRYRQALRETEMLCARIENVADPPDEWREELAQQVEKMMAVRREIVQAIGALPDATQECVLRCRFIDGFTVEETAPLDGLYRPAFEPHTGRRAGCADGSGGAGMNATNNERTTRNIEKAPAGQQEANAALAALAAAGNDFALAQLWEINRPILRRMFWRWYDRNRSIADAAGLSVEDFEQEGYFAVKEAAEYYDPEKGKFLTVLQFFVQKQIRAATIGSHGRSVTTEDGRNVRLPADPLSNSASLDEPLPGDAGEDERTRADTVPDPAVAREFEGAEEAVYREQLRAALDNALSLLPDRQREVIQKRFFEGLTFKQIAEGEGITTSRAAQVEATARRALRRNVALRRFYGEDLLYRAYHGTGFCSWSRNGSVEEHIVELQEEKEQREAAAFTKHLAELLGRDAEWSANVLEALGEVMPPEQ